MMVLEKRSWRTPRSINLFTHVIHIASHTRLQVRYIGMWISTSVHKPMPDGRQIAQAVAEQERGMHDTLKMQAIGVERYATIRPAEGGRERLESSAWDGSQMARRASYQRGLIL